MKPNKITYYTGRGLDFTYEYRSFEYSREFKKMLKEYGLKVTKIIDNYLDKDIDKISWEDKYYIYELRFKYNKIYQGKLKKESYE